MSNEQDENQQPDRSRRSPERRSEGSFHWPPTAEELDTIQVVAMSDLASHPLRRSTQGAMVRASTSAPVPATSTPATAKPAASKPAAAAWNWMLPRTPRHVERVSPPPPPVPRRWFDGPLVAQAGLVAVSLAAIGIAVTSALAPAQPASHARTSNAPSAIAAQASDAAITMPPARLQATSQQAARLGATPATGSTGPSRAEADESGSLLTRTSVAGRPVAQRGMDLAGGSAAARTRAGGATGSSASSARGSSEPRPVIIWSGKRPAQTQRASQVSTRNASGRAAPAGSDPVSRFAARTGSGLWKAMRAVGRSFKRDEDALWTSRSAARSGSVRRTASVAGP
jgi:hypothetical protein